MAEAAVVSAPAAAAPATPAPAAPAQAPAAAPTASAPAAAPAKAPANAAPAPGADASAAGNDAPAAKGYWPEDWQKNIAGNDEKELKQIGRYASPRDIWQKARALEQRLSSGELKPALPKEPKPAELAAWRKDNGIPEKATDYDLRDLKIPAEDKEIVGGIVGRLHQRNATPEVVREAVQAYYDEQGRQSKQRLEKDEEQRVAALDTLNSEYGGQFRRNINLLEGTLSKFPKAVQDAMRHARMPDGTALFNHPDIIRGFVALALESNPAGIVVPAGGGDMAQSALAQYEQIQKDKVANRPAFNKDTAKQEHERNLIDVLVKNGVMDSSGKIIQRKAA